LSASKRKLARRDDERDFRVVGLAPAARDHHTVSAADAPAYLPRSDVIGKIQVAPVPRVDVDRVVSPAEVSVFVPDLDMDRHPPHAPQDLLAKGPVRSDITPIV